MSRAVAAMTAPRDDNGCYWDAIFGSLTDAGRATLWRTYSDTLNGALLAAWLPTDRVARVLKTDAFDEALGEGLYPLLASRAGTVVALDVSVVALERAQARHIGLKPTAGDARCLPFGSGVFDIIVSNSTLDHFRTVDEIAVSLSECHRVLRQGGQLLLTLDNLANPAVALRNALPFGLLNRLGIVPYSVGATCGPRRLERMLQQARFSVMDVGAILHVPRVLGVAASRVLDRHAGPRTRRRFVAFLMAFERLATAPTRFWTGYFVTVRAVKD
jgi:SAM-dependent methyltransferase